MPFAMNCNNKGCGKHQTPTLNQTTNDVECSECGKSISGVTDFAKRQMKSFGQIKKPKKVAFSVKCNKCNQEALPALDIKNNLICSQCNAIHQNIPISFALLIRDAIKKGSDI